MRKVRGVVTTGGEGGGKMPSLTILLLLLLSPPLQALTVVAYVHIFDKVSNRRTTSKILQKYLVSR